MAESTLKATEVIQGWLLRECGYNDMEKVWNLVNKLHENGYEIINITTLERILDGP